MTEGSREAVQVTWPPLVTARTSSGLRPVVSLPGPRVATRQSLERLKQLCEQLERLLGSPRWSGFRRCLWSGLDGDAFGGVNGSLLF